MDSSSNKEAVTPLTAPQLMDEGVKHGFFTKSGGVSQGLYEGLNVGFGSQDRTEDVLENRRRAMAALNLAEDSLTSLYQIHSATVVTATETWDPAQAPKADGIVTDRPGVTLGILTADCAPVLFSEPGAGVIGACHAGWKGALANISENTITAMEYLGAKRDKITAVIGPCIAQVSYEVGEEFEATFLKEDISASQFFQPGVTEQKRQFDLPGFILNRLQQSGVKSAAWIKRDTRAEEAHFFSYRRSKLNRDADYGRLLSAIALRDNLQRLQ